MSELRVNRIQSNLGPISISGITTFSGTGCLTLPVGTNIDRTESPEIGQIRYIQGDILKTVEYYNGVAWVTLGVA